MPDTVHKSAAISAPAAFSGLIDSGALPAGLYDVEITTLQAGTVDTNPRNIGLALGGTGLPALLSLATPTTVRFTLDNPTGANLYVTAGEAAAGVGSVYCVQFAATLRD